MSFEIVYDRTCCICHSTVQYKNSIQSNEQGCESCNEIYFVCSKCDGSTCPRCNTALKTKNNMFGFKLFKAISDDDVDSVRAVLQNSPCDIDTFDLEGKGTPLMRAAIGQQFEVCKLLVDEFGANVGQQDKGGRTPLIEMVRCRGSKWHSQLAEMFKTTVNTQDKSGNTALMFAAQGAGLFGSTKGNLRIATQLLDMGADLSLVNNRGLTALGCAIKSNKSTKASSNDSMVAYITERMKIDCALRLFRNGYTHEFSDKGVLLVSPKQ